VGADSALAGADATRLDLGEHERASVAGDQVDLTAPGAYVARQDREAQTPQVGVRQLLAQPRERPAPVAGAGAATLRRGGTHRGGGGPPARPPRGGAPPVARGGATRS